MLQKFQIRYFFFLLEIEFFSIKSFFFIKPSFYVSENRYKILKEKKKDRSVHCIKSLITCLKIHLNIRNTCRNH